MKLVPKFSEEYEDNELEVRSPEYIKILSAVHVDIVVLGLMRCSILSLGLPYEYYVKSCLDVAWGVIASAEISR
jgi:hypothetical protein